MRFKRGDHICSIYSTRAELIQTVAGFLADGLRHRERCWYVASSDESEDIAAALGRRGVDVGAETRRGALKLIAADGAYIVRGAFDPEATTQIFNDAIEQAYTDGFTGFRAAAEMSWALDHEEATYQLIVYEALLRTLFRNCRAIGLCLYDRQRMPLTVINGALVTHPIIGSQGRFAANPFYDAATDRLTPADDDDVLQKLAQLDRPDDSYLNQS